MATVTLYHYTCSHHVDRIAADGALLSIRGQALAARKSVAIHPLGSAWGWMFDAVWLTDLPTLADPSVLGLRGYRGSCDRSEWRYTVDTADATPWLRFARSIPAYQRHLARGTEPWHWWILPGSVPVDQAPVHRPGLRPPAC